MTTMIPELPAAATGSLVARRNPARHGPVLLAIDGSEVSAAAASAAQALAQRLGVPLRVVSVVEPWPYYVGAVGMWPIPSPPEADIRESRESTLRTQLDSMVTNGEWSLDVRTGQPAREIRIFAREIDATVIVISAAPHRGLGLTISGTRAAQVLRGAPCPVLSVPASFNDLPRRVVVAVDFSASSIRAARTALMLVHPEATVTLVHVVASDELRPTAYAIETFDDQTRKSFDRLREQLAPYAPSDVLLETRVRQGSIVPELLDHVTSLGADMIVVGTQGPSLMQRMFLGSTASDILHLAQCTVLASPPPSLTEAIDLELQVLGTTTVAKAEGWTEMLDKVSRRDAGRVVSVEVDDNEIGAQIEASGYLLRGMTFDPHDRRIAIMLEAPEGAAHLTHSIPNADSITMITAPDGRDRALAIHHGRAQTIVAMSG